MKLSAKYNRINIAATIAVFILGSVCYYFVLRYVLIHQLDQSLHSEQQEISQYVNAHGILPEIENTKEQKTSFAPVAVLPAKPIAKSVQLYNDLEKENELCRQYIFPLKAGNKDYTVTVTKSQEETEDLIQIIILITILMVALVLLVNFIINRKVLSRLWNPFYTTVNYIKGYHLSGSEGLHLEKTDLDEFSLLNESLNQMSLRAHNDYTVLKKFTENAAHEMQTPLAVIRSKTEVMMQGAELKESSMQHLKEIEDAALKLGKLHQSLLLLAKLENNQFVPGEKVDLKKIITEKINEKQDLFQARHLILQTSLEEVTVSFHTHLAEILITNLLNNALRYTPAGGQVMITLTGDALVITNTAFNDALDKSSIFQRFYKPENSPEGTGLGLAIVKEICVTAGFSIDYFYADKEHIFVIKFKSIY